ncbi:MAG TPA: 2-amino-4-hydroxy-6-hydroxymethyldihydropteridine diphosphokinase [Candidatus Limnocylindria bacterium]|nr:2-amino-4-hydroxy-6-hydroxymethyldihydropteridine diphosphokinase [Candidatus Limnocylindria bacterium]
MNTAAGQVVVALGSNLGDSAAQVSVAIDRLAGLAAGAVRRSSLWQSTPVDCPPGSPLFVNAVAMFRPLPGETPESLLTKLQALEREFGRRPKLVLNEARPLDLDVIAWGDEQVDLPGLVLPHPRAHLRRFVLEPLAELAPGLVLPGQSQAVRELLTGLSPDPDFRRLA